MTPLFKKFLGINWILVLNMLALMAFGLYAIYNASYFREEIDLQNKWTQQLRWMIIGIPIFFVTTLIDYKWVRWGAWLAYPMGIAGLIAVKLFGVEKSGAVSWLSIGGVSVQPSQFAVVSGVILLAIVFGDLQRVAPVFRYPSLRLLLGGILTAVPCLMILKEPDLGSAAVWGPLFVALLLVGSIPFRYLITLVLIALCVVPIAYFFGLKPYQQKRIDTYVAMLTDGKFDVQADAWVPYHVRLAVGSAGFDGKGPESKRAPDQRTIHRSFFPKDVAINDFIFGVIAEEFGFRGGLLLISGMALLLLQGIFVAFYARDQLGRLLVVGIVAVLFTHSFMNMGMSIILVPITGLPMPFVSYGGTFMVVTLFLMGLVQSVWVHRKVLPSKKRRN
jgi:rod shape determining protein RodA